MAVINEGQSDVSTGTGVCATSEGAGEEVEEPQPVKSKTNNKPWNTLIEFRTIALLKAEINNDL